MGGGFLYENTGMSTNVSCRHWDGTSTHRVLCVHPCSAGALINALGSIDRLAFKHHHSLAAQLFAILANIYIEKFLVTQNIVMHEFLSILTKFEFYYKCYCQFFESFEGYGIFYNSHFKHDWPDTFHPADCDNFDCNSGPLNLRDIQNFQNLNSEGFAAFNNSHVKLDWPGTILCADCDSVDYNTWPFRFRNYQKI